MQETFIVLYCFQSLKNFSNLIVRSFWGPSMGPDEKTFRFFVSKEGET